MREPYHYQGDQVETIHVYMLREQDHLVVDAQPEPDYPTNQHTLLGYLCCGLLVLLCVLAPLTAILYAGSLPDYDTTISRTLTLTLSLHPTTNHIPLYQLPPITGTKQATAKATGTFHQDATPATGLITFYNGSFTAQTVASGTRLTGKDGVTILTSQTAVIPPATPTTPPTYAAVSVTAFSSMAGTAGNIPASDIDQACCGSSILAQNLYPFSGGNNSRDVTIVTKGDIANTTATSKTILDQETTNQAQNEAQPWQELLPLSCTITTTATHQPGDQAQAVSVTVSEHCNVFVYTLADVQQQATRLVKQVIPRGYSLVRLSLLLLTALVTDAHKGTGVLTIQSTAFLAVVPAALRPYGFGGK